MVQIILFGIGAGVAGALLFVSPFGGTMLAFPLFALCALPVAIAGLAWTWLAGVIAAVVAGALIAVYLAPSVAAIYLLLFALPIVWTSRLAGLWRETDPGSREWYPLGRILLHAATAVAGGAIAVGIIIGFDPKPLAVEMTEVLSAWLAQSPEFGPAPTPAEIEPFVRFNMAVMPVTVSVLLLILHVFSLWLAARIAWASGRLTRPREPVWTAVLPFEAAAAFIIAAIAAFIPGAPGQAAAAVAGAFGAAFALVGLAVVHAVTRGNNLRSPMLVGTYVLLVFFGFALVVFAALGLAETFLHLRARKSGGAPTH